MGQQKPVEARHSFTHLGKIPNSHIKSFSCPKVARNQPRPRAEVISRSQQKPTAAQEPSKNESKTVQSPKPLKSSKVRSQKKPADSSILLRSIPPDSEFQFNFSNAKPSAKKIRFDNIPKISAQTKRLLNEYSPKDFKSLPKKLQYFRRDDQNANKKKVPLPYVTPVFWNSLSIPSKINSVELKRRELIKSSKKTAAKTKSPEAKRKIISPKQSDTKNKQLKSRKVPKSRSYDLPKRNEYYPSINGIQELTRESDVTHSLPKLPGELRSILKGSMNYSQIKKLDEDSLDRITEGKGPVDECICNLLSNSDSRDKGIKASIKRAFASMTGGKKDKKGGGRQNSADIPISFIQGGKGGMYSTKEVLKRKFPCGRCGCDKGPVVMKHSYANIRITSPDLSTVCPCPEDCFPDKDKYNGRIKVTVERMALNSDDSELSLYRRKQQIDIPEPLLGAALESLCPILASGGDAQPARNLHCLLCGAPEQLTLISEDHADETLRKHFGFAELPQGLICGTCRTYLRITVGFSALVKSSLNGRLSKELLENADTLTNASSIHKILAITKPGTTNLSKLNQDLQNLGQTTKDQRKRKRSVTNPIKSPVLTRKRLITKCLTCGQKYPVMVGTDSVLDFICSRCNQKNQRTDSKTNGTLENQKRCALKGKIRLNCLSKTPQQVKPLMLSETRLRTSKQPKELSPKITHLRQVHKGGSIPTWDKKMTVNLASNGNMKYGRYLIQHTKTIKHEQPTHLLRPEKTQVKNIWH